MADQTHSPDEAESPLGRTCEESRQRIDTLHRLSRRGLWGLLAFILLTTVVVQTSRLVPDLPHSVRQTLGASPSENLISIALAVYIFSALILILARMMGGTRIYRGWSHLGYLSAFYLFYYYARALDRNFWAVFAAGMTILALEYYGIWSWCSESIRRERENLSQLERKRQHGLGA